MMNNVYDFSIAFKSEENISEVYSKIETYFLDEKKLKAKCECELNEYIAERNNTLGNPVLTNKLDIMATKTVIKHNATTRAYTKFDEVLAGLIFLKEAGVIVNICDVKNENFKKEIEKAKAENDHIPLLQRIKTKKTPVSQSVLNVSFLVEVL